MKLNNPINYKVALIGPSFFGYLHAIKEKFNQSGVDTAFFDERVNNNLITKILNRLGLHKILPNAQPTYLKKLLNNLINQSFTDVYLIDVETIEISFVKTLRSNNINVHLYMWDSSNNKDSFIELLPYVSNASTFDPIDSKNLKIDYIPLFAEDCFSLRMNQVKKNCQDFVFLGTMHSRRINYLQSIEKLFLNLEVTLDKKLYYHSRLLFLIKSLANIRNFYYFKQLKFSPYSKEEISLAYLKSAGVIDIHHEGQAGLTSRTFEALRAGCTLITFNENVYSLPKSLHDRVIFLRNLTDLNQIDLSSLKYGDIKDEDDYFLSLDRFVAELMNYLK